MYHHAPGRVTTTTLVHRQTQAAQVAKGSGVVALASVRMKSFERLVLSHLKTLTDALLDPPAIRLQSHSQHGPSFHPPAPGLLRNLRQDPDCGFQLCL